MAKPANGMSAIALAFLCVSTTLQGADTVTVLLKTSKGDIKLELDRELAPITVDNFVQYAKDGYYEGVIFHRIMSNFMIQTGGFVDKAAAEKNVAKKGLREPIKNESANGLSNALYTIAMARTTAPNSATSQFFINTADNAQILDRKYCQDGVGYCVFGKVVEGKDVVDTIKSVAVTPGARGERSVPKEHITIEKAIVMESKKPETEKKE
jgi:peptidyl-prolyl cis-trans isomerase B (cyclophilin B)